MTAVIKTEKLTKYYGKHRGIIDVDLDVNEGEAFGFLGPNGAGKTTMIRTLLDHIRPTSGRATIFGIETTADPVAIHKRLGYLPGEFALYDKLTGGQTLDYFANLRGGIDRSYQQKLIERLEVDPTRKFREYSKGNKQKIGLIIALQHRPDLLLLDEPTSRPRPADPAGVLRRHPRGQGRGPDRLPVARTSCPRSRRRATASPSSAAASWRASIGPRRCATSPTTRSSWSSPGPVPTAEFEALPGVSDVVADDHVLRMRVSGNITDVVRTAAKYELADFVSREPSLEETFLAEYGRAAEPAPEAAAR